MRTIAIAALALCLGMAEASAADVAMGARLAQRWCTACHVIGKGGHGQDTAPSLPPAAASHRDRTWLHAWLTSPHPSMPDMHLSREEIDDIIAYLDSLPKK